MSKLTFPEFFSILKSILVDALYPDYVHIPGLGIRMKYESFARFSEDIYRSYLEKGEEGIVLFLDMLKKNPGINLAVEKTKKIIYSHIDTVGIKNEKEKQEYISGIVDSVENTNNPTNNK